MQPLEACAVFQKRTAVGGKGVACVRRWAAATGSERYAPAVRLVADAGARKGVGDE